MPEFVDIELMSFGHSCEYDDRKSTAMSSISACHEEHKMINNILAQYVDLTAIRIGVNYFMHKMCIGGLQSVDLIRRPGRRPNHRSLLRNGGRSSGRDLNRPPVAARRQGSS